MHYVPHVAPGDDPIENSWQRLWRSIGLDKLLALIGNLAAIDCMS